jgi:hypothetical protein
MLTTANITRRPQRRQVPHSTMHLFEVGQAVRLKHSLWGTGNVYLITAKLPPVGDAPQYRIRNEGEKFERMATQDNLAHALTSTGGASAALLERSFGP